MQDDPPVAELMEIDASSNFLHDRARILLDKLNRRRPASGATEHVRLTALAATELPAFVLGALLVTPGNDSRGLTSRELQVLGLLVEGRSNQQIATRPAVAPRTVATHVEHLLDKLDPPTRTVAAVRAEQEGCYVPPAPLPTHPPERRTARTQPPSLSLNIR